MRFRLVSLSFRGLCEWKRGATPKIWEEFDDVLEERGEEIYQKICGIIRERAEKDEQEFDKVPYGLSGKTGWKELRLEAEKLDLEVATLKK